MAASQKDIWTQWMLERRFGGNPQRMQVTMDALGPIRDKILAHARLGEGQVLIDVGCGDGLIGFGVLDKTETARVIFSDVSQELVDHTRALAEAMGVLDRCDFLCAPAEDLSALPDASVDILTTRSVLIYVGAKWDAFRHFYRVLRPGGRLSLFEPINRFRYPEPAHLHDGFDVGPVQDIAAKVKAVYRRIQPDTDPLLDFDERDLFAFAEKVGFHEIHLELYADLEPFGPRWRQMTWDTYWQTAWSPKIPTLEEAVRQSLTPEEATAFVAHLRPLVEAKQGRERMAFAYLYAVKA